MKKLLVFVFVGSLLVSVLAESSFAKSNSKSSAASAVGGKCVYNKKWTNCKVDSDCTVIPGVCGFWDGVINKKYSGQAKRYYACEGARAGCVQPDATNNPKPAIACLSGTCMPLAAETKKRAKKRSKKQKLRKLAKPKQKVLRKPKK